MHYRNYFFTRTFREWSFTRAVGYQQAHVNTQGYCCVWKYSFRAIVHYRSVHYRAVVDDATHGIYLYRPSDMANDSNTDWFYHCCLPYIWLRILYKFDGHVWCDITRATHWLVDAVDAIHCIPVLHPWYAWSLLVWGKKRAVVEQEIIHRIISKIDVSGATRRVNVHLG